MHNFLLRKIVMVVLVGATLVATYYLISASLSLLLLIGLITPVWLSLVLLLFVIFWKKKS